MKLFTGWRNKPQNLRELGVESWEELKGKTIRVRKTDEWGSIISIGHIIKDDWFNPKEELKGEGK